MVVWNVFFATILLPAVGIALLARRPRRPLIPWVATLVLAAGMAGFGILVAPWGWFGIPMRIALGVAFVAALIGSLLRKEDPEAPPMTPVRIMVMLLIGAFFGRVAMGVLMAYSVPQRAIDLGFPLANGTYIAGQGGSDPTANLHSADPSEQYAVDVMKLNSAWMRARGIYPDDAKAYAIFGETVLSPCDGVVVKVADGVADASRMSVDEKNPDGNLVMIRCGDVDVALAHLQRGSISVRPGAKVTRGQSIARAGNSGNSSEPHLHIHAERLGSAVPIRFDGRWLVRNSLIRK